MSTDIAEVVLGLICFLSAVSCLICIILVFTLKGEKAKIAGYAIIGCAILFLLSLGGYIATGNKKSSSTSSSTSSYSSSS